MNQFIKVTCIIIIGLAILGAVSGISSSGSQSASPDAPAAATAPADVPTDVPTEEAAPTAVPVVRVDILTLAQQYDANKLRAQAYYKDRVIQVRGVAGDVNQDLLGSYYVSVRPGGDYYGMTQVQCFVSDQNQLIDITNGQSVTVRGTVDDMSLGIIPLKDCQVVP